MNNQIKKKIAKEILILFASVFSIALISLGIWCYKSYIDNSIENKNNIIKSENELQSKLLTGYENKFQKIKSFLLLLKDKETWGSNYTLYLVSKEMKIAKAIKKYETEQSINGTIPTSNDSISYMKCFKLLIGIYIPEDMTVKNAKSQDVISIWNCLSSNKENLYYFLPLPVLREYKIETKSDLKNFIKNLSFSENELTDINLYNESIVKNEKLRQEIKDLTYKTISKHELIYKIKIISLIVLLIVYPFRYLISIFKWSIKNYKNPNE